MLSGVGGWVWGGVPALPNIAGPLPQGDVAAVDRRMEAAGACQGWTHCRAVRPALLPPNSPPPSHSTGD